MIVIIENNEVAKIYQGVDKGKSRFSPIVKKALVKTIKMLKFSDSVAQIKKIRGLNFEGLKGDLKGKFSVRVDIKYRLILRVEKDQVLVEDVIVIEDLTNHYQ